MVEEHTYVQEQRSIEEKKGNIPVTTTSNSKGYRCISALLKLSMSKESHEWIIEPENMRVILIYLDKLNFYLKRIPAIWGV